MSVVFARTPSTRLAQVASSQAMIALCSLANVLTTSTCTASLPGSSKTQQRLNARCADRSLNGRDQLQVWRSLRLPILHRNQLGQRQYNPNSLSNMPVTGLLGACTSKRLLARDSLHHNAAVTAAFKQHQVLLMSSHELDSNRLFTKIQYLFFTIQY